AYRVRGGLCAHFDNSQPGAKERRGACGSRAVITARLTCCVVMVVGKSRQKRLRGLISSPSWQLSIGRRSVDLSTRLANARHCEHALPLQVIRDDKIFVRVVSHGFGTGPGVEIDDGAHVALTNA